MSQSKPIVEFVFVTNKSFLGPGNPITIPSRFYPSLKENGLIDSTSAVIRFSDGTTVSGSIYVGWRAGGKYYQIRMKAQENHEITRLKQGFRLPVRIDKQAEEWMIQLQ